MKLGTLTTLATALALPALAAVQPAQAQSLPQPDTSSIWTLQDENSSLSTARLTDRFYVNGFRLGWTSPTTVVPDFLRDLGNTLWGPGQTRIAFDLTQQIYTPANTTVSIPDPHDRPYAGVLLGNFSLVGDGDDTRSVLMLSFGVAGPGADAQGVQNSFHNIIGQ